MALKKECPNCKYRNSVSKRKCVKCSASLVSPDVVYWVDVWIGGRRIRERIGPSRSAAEARELSLKRQKAEAKALGTDLLAQTTKLEDLWPRYLTWCRVNNRDPKTKKHRWEKHLKTHFGRLTISEVSIRDAESYRMKRLQEGARPATVNRELSIIRHMLSMAVKWGFLESNPLAGLGSLPENNDDAWRYLTREEFDTLLAHLSTNYRDLCIFLVYTGLRLGDALRLTWADVNLDQGVVLIRGVRTKSGRTFGIPLHPKALEVLHRRAKVYNGAGPIPGDRIFKHSDSEFRRAFKKALKSAGLPTTIRIHDLRHTFASWLALKGVPIQQIQALLGHRQLTTTLRYAHLNPAILREAVEKIS